MRWNDINAIEATFPRSELLSSVDVHHRDLAAVGSRNAGWAKRALDLQDRRSFPRADRNLDHSAAAIAVQLAKPLE